MCFLIPVYDHAQAMGPTLARLRKYDLDCLLVDDGSALPCATVLDDLAREHAWVDLIRRPANGGKGAAVKTGFAELSARGYTHVFQIDADGQHDTGQIGAFLKVSQQHPDAVVLGTPSYDHSVSNARFYGRYLSHMLVWINTLSFAIEDCMCGFRIYPLSSLMQVLRENRVGDRMDFDIEILVRLSWQGVQFLNRPVRVGYPEDGVSHFRMVEDNAIITRAHIRLFFGMIRRLPRLVKRAFLAEPARGEDCRG